MRELVAYAVRYETKDEKGETRSDRNKRFGVESPEPPEVPEPVEHLCEWFWELSAQRGSGPEPLQFQDIQAWADLCGESPRIEEVKMLLQMDSAYREAAHRESEEAAARRKEAEEATRGKAWRRGRTRRK